ncbi:protein root UVB sensitive 6 isoform X2 [Malania oleifera]|uniref:protein root UVB sensitive 6 isoform X2 n=1 Tax=Malania oleifera TaxID=397392 RepID=UPI0025AE3A81|nr:protein root UVB sensitive 6 isoform X2 [Malania oleifera]
MAPIQLKRSPPQTLTNPQDARLLVRETIRISANLASAPPSSPSLSSSPASGVAESRRDTNLGLLQDDFVDSSLRLICCEEIDGRRWKYVVDNGAPGCSSKGSLRAISLHTPLTPVDELMSFIQSYVVPEGFPDSVAPSYVPYMTWRALKDGAGRVGKMIFARQGKKFDYDLKQLRFAGDLLMELGAGVELATAAVPHLFLPLACAANVVKNVAAVTSTSTRTPIYKAFARGENIGDVTAKGECVGNIADLLGTGLSIMISKRNPSLVTTFALLSCGYVLSSYQEVKSVVLRTLNRARFTVAAESYLRTGQVPSLQEGNMMEDIFSFPWLKDRPIVLGPRFKDAFQDPSSYLAVERLFEDERYIVTFNPSKGKVYALLKDKAKSDDILKAAFHAHVLLHFIHSSNKNHTSKDWESSNLMLTITDLEDHIAKSCKMVSTSYGLFKSKAAEQGWMMSESLLNPGRARLC